LEGFLGFEPREVKLNYTANRGKTLSNLEKSAGRVPSWKFYPGNCLTTEENHGKPQLG